MKKIVTIEMDKARNLKYGMNAMIELENELGKPIASLADGEFKLQDLRTMLYIGLKWEDKKLTKDQVGDLMDLAIENNGMEYLSEKLGEALKGAFGKTAMPSKK